MKKTFKKVRMGTFINSNTADKMNALQGVAMFPKKDPQHVGIPRLAAVPKSGSILPPKHQLLAIFESVLSLPMTRINLFQNSTKYVSFMLKLCCFWES